MKKSFMNTLFSKARGNLRSKILCSLLCLTFLMMVYTSIISFQLASDQISEVSLRLSESNTASAVSAIDKKLESIHEYSTQFTTLDELEKIATLSLTSTESAALRDIFQQNCLLLQANATTADIDFKIISVLLKNNYCYNTHSLYSLPFTDYDSCITYFAEQGIDLSGSYVAPKWVLCTADKNGEPINMLLYLRFVYQTGNLDKLGLIAFGIEEKWISEYYTSFAPNACILNKQGIVYSSGNSQEQVGSIYQSNPSILDSLRSESSDQRAASFTYTDIRGNEAILTCQRLRQMPAYLVVPFDLYEGIAAEEMQSFLQSILIMFVCGLAAVAVLAYFISRGLSRSILSLRDFAKQVEHGQTDLRYSPQGTDEVAYLGQQFNKTLDQLQLSAQQREENLKAAQMLELQLNQMQINPHLLYNTLDSALWLMTQDSSEDACELIKSMSEFFKVSLSKGHTLIPLKNELELISNYLNIQKLARKQDIHIEFEIEEKLYSHLIIKQTLQPLVENAVVHGFSGYRDDGTISISAKHQDNCVQLQITDNGIGILPEEVEELNRILQLPVLPENFPHFGVFNINRRIIQTYGNEYGIFVESEVGLYTTIHMKIPYIPSIPTPEDKLCSK